MTHRLTLGHPFAGVGDADIDVERGQEVADAPERFGVGGPSGECATSVGSQRQVDARVAVLGYDEGAAVVTSCDGNSEAEEKQRSTAAAGFLSSDGLGETDARVGR